MRMLLALVLLALPSQAQVLIAPAFEEGRVDRYRLDATITVEQEGEEAFPARTLSQRVELRFRTAHVDDEGRAIVTMKIDRVDVSLTVGEDLQEHAWPTVEAVMPNDLAKAWAPLADTVLRFGVDDDGRVHAAVGNEALAERIDGLDIDGARSMLGLLSPEVLERTFAPVWDLDGDAEPRAPGDTWALTETVGYSGERRAIIRRSMTLDFVDETTAAIGLASSVEPVEPDAPTLVTVDLRGKGSGEASWNHARAILERFREDLEIVLEASLGEEDPITTRVTRRWSMTRLEGDS